MATAYIDERLIATTGDTGKLAEGFKHVDFYRADWLIVVSSHSLVKCENIDARIRSQEFRNQKIQKSESPIRALLVTSEFLTPVSLPDVRSGRISKGAER